ncbi:hypothetical protein ACKWTF_015107 [Chironomus riparius]
MSRLFCHFLMMSVNLMRGEFLGYWIKYFSKFLLAFGFGLRELFLLFNTTSKLSNITSKIQKHNLKILKNNLKIHEHNLKLQEHNLKFSSITSNSKNKTSKLINIT